MYPYTMLELIEILNIATIAYNEGNPVMTDKEWDDLYFMLVKMEEDSKIIYPHSPTTKINYEFVDSLEKIKHSHSMLSLDKTKDINEVQKYIDAHNCMHTIMAKMDGLTCSLRYKDGKLVSAETRGDGEIGELVTHNAKVISNIPQTIDYKDTLIIDGEIIIQYNDFEKLNVNKEYKNPRNLAAGSIRLLDSKEAEKRCLKFVAWRVVEGFNDCGYYSDKLLSANNQGFSIVPFLFNVEDYYTIEDDIQYIKDKCQELYYPIDGCVIGMDDIEMAEALGQTAHHLNSMYAFKFYDEEYETRLIDIEWSMGRTGQLTPVAIFEDVDTGDSICNRASLHNITIMNNLSNGYQNVGDKLTMIKSNQIIPQIVDWEHDDSWDLNIVSLSFPSICPVCGALTEIKKEKDSEILYCSNPDCEGKLLNKLVHFCSKKGLDIKGLSKARLNRFMDEGFIDSIEDLFTLKDKRNDLIKLNGFGEKSIDAILNAIEIGRHCSLNSFISALGIQEIGNTVSKVLVSNFPTWEEFRALVIDKDFSFTCVEGIGEVMNKYIKNFDYTLADRLVDNYIDFNKSENENKKMDTSSLKGKTFVITGKLKCGNRDSMAERIAAAGGKVVGSISAKVDYLVNNDINSTTAKNKKAKELNIPIINEDDLLAMF